MDVKKLKPATAKLWSELQHDPLLHGFVLIGGTALALRIGHRLSEDLDFAYPAAGKLPRQTLARFIEAQAGINNHFAANDDLAAVEEAINDGLDLHDYQQDYLVNEHVKVTFWAPEREMAQLLRSAVKKPLRVATIQEIFETKCLVCADRSKTRDWFDLYILMTQHGYSMLDAKRMFDEAGLTNKYDIFDMRLRKLRPLPDDEGYEHLLASAPTLDEMRDFFTRALDELQVQTFMSAQLAKSTKPGKTTRK
jgi:predicted nucleotidyltransferase component of viral defense system